AQPKFMFSTSTEEVVKTADLKGSQNIDAVRPNTAREINLFAHNEKDDPRDLKIQLLNLKGKILATAEIKKAAGKSYNRVKFPKAAPPAADAGSCAAGPAAGTDGTAHAPGL